MKQELYMTRLYWVEESTQLVWNVCKNIERCTALERKIVNRKPCK